MHLIVAALHADIRQALRASLLAAGHPCDETADSPAQLQRRLDRSLTSTMVVTAPQEEQHFRPIALQRGVPLLIWPAAAAVTGLEGRALAAEPQAFSARLTAREREILALVAAGISNKGIARRLHVSVNTVKFHLGASFVKLRVGTRAEAIAAAARLGALSL